MTIEKALEILRTVDGIECKIPGYTTALGTAIQALEKQMPKKVFMDMTGNGEIFDFVCSRCPNCSCTMSDEDKPKYCPDCGQALDWSDNDE